jgi:hypothetical protein
MIIKAKYYWTMKNGKKIDVDEMTEDHLRNVLKLIIKRNQQTTANCPNNIEQTMDLEPYAEDYLWKE